MEDGYYKEFRQLWWESINDKTGWEASGWGEEKDFEIYEVLETDKHDHPTRALFKYTGPVFLGLAHAAMNLQARLLGEFIEYSKKYHGRTFEDAFNEEPEFKRINDCINLLEERYEIKKYLKGE